MCGISGFAYSGCAYKGPDSEGLHTDAGAVPGMRRLSIIDLKTGDQLWDDLFRNGCLSTEDK